MLMWQIAPDEVAEKRATQAPGTSAKDRMRAV
jgi:hypothetical protein